MAESMVQSQPTISVSQHRERLIIQGVVQGVGFRPFVYRVAKKLGLNGFVQNNASGVLIEIEGSTSALQTFYQALKNEQPVQSQIHNLSSTALTPQADRDFIIRPSAAGDTISALMLTDLAVCSDCLRELRDPADRRYRYPFINCTNCGPRFSIIKALPYDRPNTSMATFDMCAACRNEYENPNDRRYHAQPIACPDCGPQLSLLNSHGEVMAQREIALEQAAQAICTGKIVAVKGLGGFHLMADARNAEVVQRLRQRKHRPAKPFALMYPSLESVQADCWVSTREAALLLSSQAPIVLLRKQDQIGIAQNIVPDNPYLGVMLPYTPLHHLLLDELNFPIIATSANRAAEPIVIDNDEALQTLKGIADVFLVHDRPIVGRCDDSIVRIVKDRKMILRRARGYAPLPVTVNQTFTKPILAVGGHLKNTVALAINNQVFLSPHIGDLDTAKACAAHREAADLLCDIYQAKPEFIAQDLHPDYRSSQMAEDRKAHKVSVQHHYAHALACMADNHVQAPCMAVTWDGTGLGSDSSIWGGEFLRITPESYERALYLKPYPLPGGEAAIRDPKRAALGVLYALSGSQEFHRLKMPNEAIQLITQALQKQLNCPSCSSVGRLFDAIAALTDIAIENTFEGQAAMALEFAADSKITEAYNFSIQDSVIDWRPMVQAVLKDMDEGIASSIIAAKFHATLSAMIVAAAKHIGENKVLLTGGCFQNVLLLEQTIQALEEAGFKVFWHRQVPPNDGGLALGQVMAVNQYSHNPDDA